MKKKDLAAYLAKEGFLPELITELKGLGQIPHQVYGNLVVVEGEVLRPVWAQNIWLSPEILSFKSISEAAKLLKSSQKYWALYSHTLHRRAQLIQDQLAYFKTRPLPFLGEIPTTPMGGWTLLDQETMLASAECSSPFPHGEVPFVEDKHSPPSRAYLKLWELFTVYGPRPVMGEKCLDLGSSPGGWTWVLQKMGCQVLSVDKAPLEDKIAKLSGVKYLQQSAFALEPQEVGAQDWVLSDVICYPERLLKLVEKWVGSGLCSHMVCTIKFQGKTDFATLEKFRQIPGSFLVHLYHNKHEVMWVWSKEGPQV